MKTSTKMVNTFNDFMEVKRKVDKEISQICKLGKKPLPEEILIHTPLGEEKYMTGYCISCGGFTLLMDNEMCLRCY